MTTSTHGMLPRPFCGFAALVLLGSISTSATGAPGDSTLISTGTGVYPAISADGRYVVFVGTGVQLYDRLTGATKRVDVGINGQLPDAPGQKPELSSDGRYVTFSSDATNLVPEGTDGTTNVYVRDMVAASTVQVSKGLNGGVANDYSFNPRISVDGSFVAFPSKASNLVPGDTNGSLDNFLWKRGMGTIELISVGWDGQPANSQSGENPSASANGRYVLFDSDATNVVPGFGPVQGNQYDFPNVFLRDRWTRTTEPISVKVDGRQPNGFSAYSQMSADARFVVFATQSTDIVPDALIGVRHQQIVLRDRNSGNNEWISSTAAGAPGDYRSWNPDVSLDGRFVVFDSESSNLVPGDTNKTGDAFLKDRLTGAMQRITVSSAGDQAFSDGEMSFPRISADGRFVVFATLKRLSPLDTDDELDVYLHEVSISAPATFSYALTPQVLGFGNQTATTSRTHRFWLKNNGTTPLPVGAITLKGENPNAFLITSNCPAWIAVGAGCALTVVFRPAWVGDVSARLEATVANMESTTRLITGSGVRASNSVLPTSLGFGEQGISTVSAVKYVTVTNTGVGVLPIKSIYLSGSNSRQFEYAHDCPVNVPVGGNCAVRVSFKPWAVGAKTAMLTVWAGGYAGPRTTVLTGWGITPVQ